MPFSNKSKIATTTMPMQKVVQPQPSVRPRFLPSPMLGRPLFAYGVNLAGIAPHNG